MGHLSRFLRLSCVGGLIAVISVVNTRAAEAGGATIETKHATLRISPEGRVVSFVDRRSGTNHLAPGAGSFASINLNGQQVNASSVQADGGLVRVTFGDTGIKADLRVEGRDNYAVIEVTNLTGGEPTVLTFIDVPLDLKGTPDEGLAACALALNLQTNVHEIPRANSRLRAMCYPRFGFAGARVAIISCPTQRLRDIMKQAVTDAPELPHSPLGGPWALDAPVNRGSYLMDTSGTVGESTVDGWINLARQLGFTQIDFHCGRCLRFGDYAPHPEVYPHGMASVKATLDRIHAAGMLAGLHTYAFFIAKDTPYVTPKADPRLAADAVFTLSKDIGETDAVIPVEESTAGVSAITGFFVRNSVTLQIGEEMVIYKRVAGEAPFGFQECQRGAYGTKPAAHPRGTKVRHLKECFGLFVPDPETTLFTEVIENTARAYNEAGFDMIYLDALDGSDILAGGENAWHYGSKFVFELVKRLNKPALFEMSTFHHHLWYVRSRMGAWDAPARGAKPFVDIHCIVNEECQRMFLPAHLGWWGAMPWDGIQPERTLSDDMEYLLAKCIGNDCGLSLIRGFDPKTFANSANSQRFAAIVRRYEQLRQAGSVPEHIKAKLREPDTEFVLEDATNGGQFRPVKYDEHKVELAAGETATFTTTNTFEAQPLRLRIEALLGLAAYGAPEAVVLTDWSAPDKEFVELRSADQVSQKLIAEPASGQPFSTSGRWAVSNGRPDARSAWATAEKKFDALTNLSRRGLGVWIHGDGRGGLLNLQLKNPVQFANAYADHYVPIDFAGWRYFELIEPESDHIFDHAWPYAAPRTAWRAPATSLMGAAYPACHYWVNYDNIAGLNLWCTEVPRESAMDIQIGPVKALPVKSLVVKNPTISLGGQAMTFPAELESGSYIELVSADDCMAYDRQDQPIGRVVPQGAVPQLQPGEQTITFTCEGTQEMLLHARVTVISRGQPLE